MDLFRGSFRRLGLLLLFSAACFAQGDDYAPENENVLLKTRPGKQLFKEDVQCGNYFWISVKAAVNGAPVLYYFYGDPAFGKNKVGLYRQDLYHPVVADQKDPPTVQVIRAQQGNIREIRVRLTAAELESSRACFPGLIARRRPHPESAGSGDSTPRAMQLSSAPPKASDASCRSCPVDGKHFSDSPIRCGAAPR